MADNEITVTITEKREDPSQCDVSPDPFECKKGGVVTFEFNGRPGIEALIAFEAESPFDGNPSSASTFKADKKDKKKVKANARLRPFSHRYKISWPGGKGAGSGEIIP